MKRTTLTLALLASTVMFRPFGDRMATVLVKGQDGKPLRINEADYDKSKHGAQIDPNKVEDAAPPAPASDPAPLPNDAGSLPHDPPAPVGGTIPPVPAPAPVSEAFVSKKGKKFVVVDKDGQSIPGTTEYDDEAAAKAALDGLKAPADAPPPPPAV